MTQKSLRLAAIVLVITVLALAVVSWIAIFVVPDAAFGELSSLALQKRAARFNLSICDVLENESYIRRSEMAGCRMALAEAVGLPLPERQALERSSQDYENGKVDSPPPGLDHPRYRRLRDAYREATDLHRERCR